MSVRPFLRRVLQISALALLLQTTGCSEIEKYQTHQNVMAYDAEADRQLTLGNQAKARDFFDRSIALDPHSASVYIGTEGDSVPSLAASLADHGDYPDLAAYLTKAVADPKLANDYQLYAGLADAQDHLGQKEQSEASYAKELSLLVSPAKGSPGAGMNPADFKEQVANAEWGSGQHNQGRKDFLSLIEDFPDTASGPQNDLAYLEAVAGENLDEAFNLSASAVKTARESEADDPELGMYLDTLGWVQFRRGQYANARASLEEAIGDIPRESVSHYHLAAIYHALGKNDDALIEANRSLILEPSNPDTQSLIAEIQNPGGAKKPAVATIAAPPPPPQPVGAKSHA